MTIGGNTHRAVVGDDGKLYIDGKHVLVASFEETENGRQLLIDGKPLLGASELAQRLGIRVQNIPRAVAAHAVASLAATPVWLGCEIEEFARRRQAKKLNRASSAARVDAS